MPNSILFSSGTPIDPTFPLPSAPQTLATDRASIRLNPTVSADTNFTRTVFTADGSATYQVVGVTGRTSIVGSTTAMLVKASGAGPIGSGLPVLASTLSLFGTVETNVFGTLIASTALLTVNPGDSIGFRWGTQGALAPEGVLEVTLARI